jgi:Pilus formation protein N terminal region
MPSRFWLALAFIAAFGPQPARAGAPPETLTITLDEAKIAKLPQGTSTLIVGNPMIADVTMIKSSDTMVLTGKGYGETNLIALDSHGAIILEKRLRVLPDNSVVVLQNGASRVSYSCKPDCMPAVQLGDDPKSFNEAGGEISARNGFAAGAVK